MKLERRKLRTYPAANYPRDQFETVANSLSELQIEAELIRRDAQALLPRLPEIGEMQGHLDAIDTYLSRVQRGSFELLRSTSDEEFVDLTASPDGALVLGFIGGRDEPGSTSQGFIAPYHEVRRELIPLLGDTLTESDTRR